MKRISVIFAVLILILTFGCNPNQENPPMLPTTASIVPLNDVTHSVSALAGTDALGREIRPATEKKDKLVGLFYFLWLGNYYYEGQQMFDEIYDISKTDLAKIFASNGGTPFSRMHFWGEPLFGYYNMRDRWVVERHIRMFIAAGIDFLAFDTTNNDYYPKVLDVVLEVLLDYQSQGYDVPKIMFLTNTDSGVRVQEIYDYVYAKDDYRSLWFTDEDEGRNPERKPWITINKSHLVYLSKDAYDCFYFKDSQWPNNPYLEDGFPWIEFTRPQPVHNGIVSVSVAQNAGMHMSSSVQYKVSPNSYDYYNSNWGRGYTTYGKNDSAKIAEGANFQEQWDNAIALDPHIIFVTGWNEWAALKLHTKVTGIGDSTVFFDCFDIEFSRDIEPMRDGYGDNFYMQLIMNVRRFKGVENSGISFDRKTVAQWSDWNEVTSGVSEPLNGARDFVDAALKGTYTSPEPVNDIVEVRAAADDKNLYFLVTAADDLKGMQDDEFMKLWLKTAAGADYNYAISGKDGSIVSAAKGDVGKATVNRSGKFVWYTISKELVDYTDAFGVQVKVAYHVAIEANIMDAYTTGDVAPYGRLNYQFR